MMSQNFDEAWAEIDGKRLGVKVRARNTYKDIKRYLRDGMSVLDIGCGPGVFVDLVCRKGYSGVGYDISSAPLDYARKHKKGVYYDTFPDGETFDVVTMIHVIEHLDEPAALLARVREVLADGGILHVIVPNVAAAHGWLGEQYRGNVFAPDHKHQWDAVMLGNELKQSRFQILSVSERMYFGTLVAALASKIYRDLLKRKPRRAVDSGKTGKARKPLAQSVYDFVDSVIPAVSRRPGGVRIFHEAIVTARCVK
jgi:2-polyprenyl-3-methyl-5-hydroxy-6-metoxy-1,4-benzoquinol methylase